MWFYPLVSTGKEKDTETGYGYFGARYMDHELMTMWLCVDPMADKYPGISPYAYCVWNPVKLVDPDGQDTIFSYACNTGNLQYNESNKRILKAMRNIGDSPILSISAHGSPQTMECSANSQGNKTAILTATNLASAIKSGTFGSFVYNNNHDNNKPTIIILYSCNTGQGNNCFGQQLSELLESSIVIAPEGAIWTNINKSGKTTIDNRIAIPTGNIARPYKKGKRCSWGIFYNGERVMSFDYPAPQSWINKQGGIDKLIEKVLKQYESNN